jgi:hypothetical protein
MPMVVEALDDSIEKLTDTDPTDAERVPLHGMMASLWR